MTLNKKRAIATCTLLSIERLRTAKVGNPMMRSGLALAGANTWLSGGTLPPNAGKGF
ncbi:MAG: hypothetical protein RMX96_16590 [Nostoc sp. ChiSLP02]|nr:hypothetical protein [Nostoc sp. DedSLP05]MDZ8100560.1 hypothetical protein [Nostoc sp. DedSLP01]MDZ8186454.1 hypothetical protein [Nostoc sp. ChiSLP02]